MTSLTGVEIAVLVKGPDVPAEFANAWQVHTKHLQLLHNLPLHLITDYD